MMLALLFVADSSLAMRCGTRLVSEGDHAAKVKRYCGEPASVQVQTLYRSGIPRLKHRYFSHQSQLFGYIDRSVLSQSTLTDSELLIHRRSVVEVQVEKWLYNRGPNRLLKEVIFEDGVVVKVKHLGRGYLE